ncbi:sensor histidine kinase [Vibrio proteolyticus]
MNDSGLQALIARYFSQPERRIQVSAGHQLIEQDSQNDRLYYVIAGELDGYFTEQGASAIKVFSAMPGAFLGVHSFFSGNGAASSTVIAKTAAELAWIDRHTAAIDAEQYGVLTTQFMPVIVNELSQRQRRATQEALAKERALQKLHLAEQMTTLGQLAAGLAHELNNAIGVVSSKSQRLESVLLQLLEEQHPGASLYYELGLQHGQKASSVQVRNKGRELERDYHLPKELARNLARAVPDDVLEPHWLADPVAAIRYWEIGRDLHDLRLATRHTVGIVKSVKQLGRTDISQDEAVDINETLHRAVALLQSDLRRVAVRIRPAELPLFTASSTELVQVWVNILKNACDAMRQTEAPEIDIQTRLSKQRILITLSNNGPEIDETTRRKIFQPSFTTKKGGLSFGLGLGLSIARRIITGYGGTIAVKSDKQRTVFRIKLPIEGK